MKIIRISAIWCPSCIIMRPIYDKIVADYNLDSIEYDYDFDEDKVLPLNVGNILPVVILYDDNSNELTRICGEKKENYIVDIIKEFV